MSLSRLTATTVTAAAALLVATGLAACTSGSSAPAAGSTVGGSLAPSGATSSGPAGAGAGSASIVPSHSSVHWHPCTGSLHGAQCGTLSVPLDYAHPGGRTLTLALSMVPATAPKSQQQGVLLVNPGGPGEPGLPWSIALAQGLSPQVAAEYDIVSFDPRGVGSSVPSLSCEPSYYKGVRPDYIPANAAAEQVLINQAKSYAADCEKRFGWLLPYETTVNIARDMDTIRQSFGVAKVNYVGYSWGTYLGQVYGTLYPGHVRRMVLDSVVDPTGAWYTDNIEQDYAFQARLDAFFAWTAKNNAAYQLGTTPAQVKAAFYQARGRLKTHPVDGQNGPLIGPDEFDDSYIILGYLNQSWPGLASALSQYINGGSTSGLLTQYQEWGVQQDSEPLLAAYDAVECADVSWPRNWSKWQADTVRVYRTAPFEAWDNAWMNAPCAFWPVKGPAKPFQVNGAALPPILMLQGTLDAATPYAGAQNAHRLLPTAKMVVVEGSGNHGQSLEYPSNQCVQNYLNNYLSAGALPTAPGLVNATCQTLPDPSP